MDHEDDDVPCWHVEEKEIPWWDRRLKSGYAPWEYGCFELSS